VAVAKTFESSLVRRAFEAGVLDIGENYVQELREKQTELGDLQIRWHFVGHLQTNKVKQVVGSVGLIHSVDSVKLGREISKAACKVGGETQVLVEVNTSGETTKHGVGPEETEPLVREVAGLPNVKLVGLMTIGPFLPDPEASRPAFRLLQQLRDSLRSSDLPLPHLSMGMTNDFEVAIEEGSTIVRIGTAIFGQRVNRQQ
jgi:hypothetical protein